MPAKKVAKIEEKKEEGFLLLIVFKVTHGKFFGKHFHYTSNLLKVKDNDEARSHTKAAKKAAETMSKDMGVKTEVIISERVKPTDQEQMHAEVVAKLGGKLGELLKAL